MITCLIPLIKYEEKVKPLLHLIETKRLYIRPLTCNQVLKYLAMDHSLELELGCLPASRPISSELKEAIEQTILPNLSNPDKNYLFCTLWSLISKKERQLVGDICIMDEPDKEGIIEIGYGVHDRFRGQGLMTEGVSGIINWAREQPHVRFVRADTDKSNMASIKILERNGFKSTSESTKSISWRIDTT